MFAGPYGGCKFTQLLSRGTRKLAYNKPRTVERLWNKQHFVTLLDLFLGDCFVYVPVNMVIVYILLYITDTELGRKIN